MNRHHRFAVAACFAGLLVSGAAHASLYTDDLSKCLVRSTTEQQKELLIQWIFAISALHPAVQPLSTVTDGKRKELDKAVADLFTTLLTDSCRQETHDAIKYDGPAALQASFSLLGQVAMSNLFSDQNVLKGLSGFTQYLDKSKFEGIVQGTPSSATTQGH